MIQYELKGLKMLQSYRIQKIRRKPYTLPLSWMIEFISQSQPLANLPATFPAIPCNHEKQKHKPRKMHLLIWLDLFWLIWFDSFGLIDMIGLIGFIYWQMICIRLRNARSLSLISSHILMADLSFCWSARSSASVSWSKSKSSNPENHAETFKPIMSHPPTSRLGEPPMENHG